MKESEKILVFGLAALFHAARIAGGAARGESSFPEAGNTLDQAQEFITVAKARLLLPKLPPDDHS